MKHANLKRWFLKSSIVLIVAFGLATIGIGHIKLASAQCSIKPNASLGQDSMPMTITARGTNTYSVWLRMLTANPKHNSIYLQVDNGCAVEVGGSNSIPANSWTWINYESGNTGSSIIMNLASGDHTVLLTGNSPNVGVDQVLFLSSSCVPKGNGSNCTQNSPPTVLISSPANDKTISGSNVNLSASATDTGTITSVQFKVDAAVVATLTSPTSGSDYSFNWDSTGTLNGEHILTVIATDAANLSSAQQLSFTLDNTTGCHALPASPTDLTASAVSMYSINLNWNGSTPVSGCTLAQYNIYRSGSNSPIASINPPTSTSFTDSGLKPGTSYSYYVTAIDTNGHVSSNSNKAKAKTAP